MHLSSFLLLGAAIPKAGAALLATVALCGFLTPELTKEFGEHVAKIRDAGNARRDSLRKLRESLDEVTTENEQLKAMCADLRKGALSGRHARSTVVGLHTRKVTDDCAEWLTSIAILGADKLNRLRNIPEETKRGLLSKAEAI